MKKILLLVYFIGLFWPGVSAQVQDSVQTKDSVHKEKNTSPRNGFGVKAGLNFANVTNVSSINGSSETGFHAGIFFGSFNKGIVGSRTELLFSQQGYGYSSDSSKGSVRLNYIMLAQFLAINVTRYVQIQAGFQMGYLLNATNKSSESTGNQTADKILDFYNRFDYGLGGGVEVHPFQGLLIGARYNLSLSNLYKESSFTDPNNTSGVPYESGIDFKNNVVQLFVGYRF